MEPLTADIVISKLSFVWLTYQNVQVAATFCPYNVLVHWIKWSRLEDLKHSTARLGLCAPRPERNATGKMSLEKVADIYRIYEEWRKRRTMKNEKNFYEYLLGCTRPQNCPKIADENGEICREDFFKFAVDTKLLDFGCVMGDSISMGLSSRSQRRQYQCHLFGTTSSFLRWNP